MSQPPLAPSLSRPLRIAVVGGGTGGHIFPLIASIEELARRYRDMTVTWFGRRGGIEQHHALGMHAVFVHLPSGKWRRYFSLSNVIDLFRIVGGIIVALWHLIRRRPDLLLSKGGYQALPLLPVAWLLRIPIIAHESDSVAGIATRVAERCGATIATTWPETQGVKHPHQVGLPIRSSLFSGNRNRAYERWQLDASKPLLLVLGGSQGAEAINELVWSARSNLLSMYSIVHMTGAPHLERYHVSQAEYQVGYRTVGFIEAVELADLMSSAAVCVTRCGSGIIELLLAGIPSVAIPLPGSASDHQARNGMQLSAHGAAVILPEKDATAPSLLLAIEHARTLTSAVVKRAAEDLGFSNGAMRLIDLLQQHLSYHLFNDSSKGTRS